MFKILDGREHFFQWDTNRKLVVSDAAVDFVHFCNRTDSCSLVVEVYEQDGLRLADVPNILLQSDWPIRVYGYCGGCYTKQMATYKVASRTKPDDYVYTETEMLNYSTLLERIEELEEKEVDLTDYIKKTDYATTDKTGVVKVKSTYGTGVIESNGQLFIVAAEEGAIDAKSSRYKPITPAYLDYAVKSVGDGYYATKTDVYTKDETDKALNTLETNAWLEIERKAYKTDVYTKKETDKALNTLEMNISDWVWLEIENKADRTEVTAAINEALGVIENGTY